MTHPTSGASRATRQQLIATALRDLGYVIEPRTGKGGTSKAITFRYAKQDPSYSGDLVFVGKLGSVRKGPNYSNSLALPASTIGKLLARGEKVLSASASSGVAAKAARK